LPHAWTRHNYSKKEKLGNREQKGTNSPGKTREWGAKGNKLTRKN